MFVYCLNSPVICADSSGCKTVVVIYDDRTSGYFFGRFGGKGFDRQADIIISDLTEEGYDVIAIPYTTLDEFVDGWNSMTEIDEDIYRVYIIGHGYYGSLDCDGKRIRTRGGAYSYDDLKSISVVDALYLYACYGALPDEFNKTAAQCLANRANCKVLAANGGVNIRWWNGKVSSKKTWLWFYPYEKGHAGSKNAVQIAK